VHYAVYFFVNVPAITFASGCYLKFGSLAGASIAINGACLTVAGIVENGEELLVEFDVMQVSFKLSSHLLSDLMVVGPAVST
jgi:riboflavin synthase alpha subunit